MVFSSLIFLFAYLPLTLAVYFVVPLKLRNLALFVLSLLFYGWGEPLYIIVMLFSVTSAYSLGFFIEKYKHTNKNLSRTFLIISLSLNLLLLAFFKYYNFFASNLSLIPFLNGKISTISEISINLFGKIYTTDFSLPIGISFYTFQIMSYSIDLYRSDAELQKNYISFGTYVTLFPQLVAGPIVRYKDIDSQLSGRKESAELFADGVRRFCCGLGKKILLGDAASSLYEYFKSANEFEGSVLCAWMIMICYTLHIYFDFSGYSDMAIGLGKMFGFTFPENFNYPYISKSITEFWRRWHISLSTWFREYVYIPLGGNRKGIVKQLRNIFIVWFLTGFWHGAGWNYILWGLYFGVILMAEKLFLLKLYEKIPRAVMHLWTLLLICIGWVIFSFTDVSEGITQIGMLFGIGARTFASKTVLYQVLRSVLLLALCAIGSTPYPKKFISKLSKKHGFVSVIISIAAIGVLFICTAYLADSTFSPFLYYIF